MTRLEIPPQLVKENRVGDVVLAKADLRDHPALMDVLGQVMFVVQMRQFAEQDELLFTAFCDKFDPHDNKRRIPRYSFDVDEWVKSGAVLFAKVAQPLTAAELKKFKAR